MTSADDTAETGADARAETDAMDRVLDRLRRARGQLAGSRAVDRAGSPVVAAGMRRCLTGPDGESEPPLTEADLEKLFLSPA